MKSGCVFLLFVLVVTLGFRGSFTTTPYKFPKLNYFPEMPLAAMNPVSVEGAKLGRYLFYDPVLSDDSTISCSGCHKQEFAFSDSPNKFSRGRNGKLMKRNSMPLFNLAWYPAFLWDGKAATLEEQIFHPIQAPDEMNMKLVTAAERLNKSKFYKKMFFKVFNKEVIDSVQIGNAIAQFLRTIISYRSKYDRMLNGKEKFTKEETAGFVLINDQTKGDCLHCHTTDADALGTILQFSNNGLDAVSDPLDYKDRGRGEVTGKVSDNGKFMIPTLRNIALTAPYMHDGRFKTLEEVLDFYSDGVNQCANLDPKMEFAHQGGVRLSEVEKRNIIAFLKTMTDSQFINDPEFSDPFGASGK